MLKDMIIDWGMRLIQIRRKKDEPTVGDAFETLHDLGILNAEMLLWQLQLNADLPDPPFTNAEIHKLFPYKRRGEKSTREVE